MSDQTEALARDQPHDHAVEHGSREAPAYRLLSSVIKVGCKAAIKISEKI